MDPYPKYPILIVDDEAHIRLSLRSLLLTSGISNSMECEDPNAVLAMVRKNEVCVVLLDLTLPKRTGDSVLEELSQQCPDVSVVIVTGNDDLERGIACMRSGAMDFILKPIDENRLLATVRRGIELSELKMENRLFKSGLLEDQPHAPEVFESIVTRNSRMQALFRYCEAVAKSSQPVLITGETGTGKELFAQALYACGACSGTFVAVNLAGLDGNMFSDTLFGHVKGAYTGADDDRPGLIEKAGGGVVFLDEIGDLNESEQIKLLRLLQEGEYTPLGSDAVKRASARFVLATHRDLNERMAQGAFRADLFYRLKTHHLHVPPLRERKEDLPLLVEAFATRASSDIGRPPVTVSSTALNALRGHDFPGNVRELRAMVFDAVTRLEGDVLDSDAFPQLTAHANDHRENPFSGMTNLPTLKDAGDLLVQEALDRCGNNQTAAAKLLGVTQQALSHRQRK